MATVPKGEQVGEQLKKEKNIPRIPHTPITHITHSSEPVSWLTRDRTDHMGLCGGRAKRSRFFLPIA